MDVCVLFGDFGMAWAIWQFYVAPVITVEVLLYRKYRVRMRIWWVFHRPVRKVRLAAKDVTWVD